MLSHSDALHIGQQMLVKHGLVAKGWTFGLNKNKSRLGVCKENRGFQFGPNGMTVVTRGGRIEVSIYCVQTGVETFMNTLLHEIAHALVGVNEGHGPVWKRKAVEIGCSGDRCGQMDVPAKYVGTCPTCGETIKANRKLKQMDKRYHAACYRRGHRQPVQWA